MGDVNAARQLIVASTGRLHGDIETACLEIEKHAFFRGTTNMTRPLSDRREAMEQGGANAARPPRLEGGASPVASHT